MLMINTCKPTNWPKARDSKFTRQSELVFEVKMLFQVYIDRLDPGKGWYVLNEELHVSALRKQAVCRMVFNVVKRTIELHDTPNL